MLGVFLQQHFKGFQSMNEALRVIEPVDAEDDLLIRKYDFRCGLRQRDEPIKRYADRQRSYPYRSTTVFDQQVLTVYSAAETSLAAIDEVQAVILNMETHHVAT